jgi:hypothetical protein
MVLWCNGLAHDTTDVGVWVRVLIELHMVGWPSEYRWSSAKALTQV